MIKRTLIISASTMLLCSVFGASAFGQHNLQDKVTFLPSGGFTISLKKQHYEAFDIKNQLNSLLGLNDDFYFEQVKEKRDFLGMTHISYEQYYRGIKVVNAKVQVHVKSGKVSSINGKMMYNPSEEPDIVARISSGQSLEIAKKTMQVAQTTAYTTTELGIAYENELAHLVYVVRLDGVDQKGLLIKHKVWVDAISGAVLKKIPLIAHTDVEATAETYYSGTRTITTDMIETDLYRLRDNTRNIETYDVSGQTPDFLGDDLFESPNDVYNNSTSWSEKPYIMDITLNSVTDEHIFEDLGLSFVSFAGNVLASVVEKDTDLTPLSRNNDFGAMGEIVLPYHSSNLFVAIDESETYTGRFFRDSVSLDFFTGSMVSNGYDTASSASFTIETGATGTYDWEDTKGNTGTYTIEQNRHPALDVHWGLSKTYDFFDEHFDYQSYDDEGSLIKNYYNGTAMYVGTQNNAAALPAPQNAMVYGTGDGIDFHPFVALDVTAHEFSHLITFHNANLEYTGESGALNEAFSDIMGAAIEFFAKPEEANWLMGEEMGIATPFLRSLSDPNAPEEFSSAYALPQPDTYNGDYWAPTDAGDPDNGGVHINSGVANFWFYLLCEGGTGTNDIGNEYDVTPVGMDKAIQIVFNTFAHYLTSSSDYEDAYHASIAAVTDMYGEESGEMTSLIAAWYAVGIPSTTGISKIPSFAAHINVYPNPATDVLFIQNQGNKKLTAEIIDITGKKMLTFDVATGNQSISVSNLTAGNYLINFSDGNGSYTKKVVKR